MAATPSSFYVGGTMKIILEENERLDEVNDKLRLIQKTDGLTFGTDALLLAAFVAKKAKRALEIGGGSGIVSLLLATRERCSYIDCLEVQETYAALIERNVHLNGLDGRVNAVCADARAFPLRADTGSYDAVFSNPPYMTVDSGAACDSDTKEIARHEHFGGIADFAATASRALKYGGAFYAVFLPERLADLISACRASNLEPKRLCFVSARSELPPSMVLLEARRGGKPGLFVTPTLILKKDGLDTEEMSYILEHGKFPAPYERRTPCRTLRT